MLAARTTQPRGGEVSKAEVYTKVLTFFQPEISL